MSSYQRRDYPSGQFKPPGQATPIAIPRNPPPAQSQNYGDRIRPEYDRQTDRRSYGGNNSNSHSNSQSRDLGYNKGGGGRQQGQGGSGGQPRARIVNPGYEDFDEGDENLRLAKGKRETDEEVRRKALATLPTKAEVDENERIAADNRAEAKKVADERKVKNAARLLREKEQQKRDDEEKRRVAEARKANPSSAAFPKAHPGVNKSALLDPNKTSTATFYGPSASGPKLPTAKRKPDAPNRDKAADAAVQRKNNSKSTGAEAGTSKGKKKPATVTIDLGSDDDEPSSSAGRKRSKGNSSREAKKAKPSLRRSVSQVSLQDDSSSDERKKKTKKSPTSPPVKTLDELIQERTDQKALAKQQRRDKKAGHAVSDKLDRLLTIDSDEDDASESDDDDDFGGYDSLDDANLDAMLESNAQRERDGGTPDLLLHDDEETTDTRPRCPFCSAPLPTSPSTRLLDLQAYLLKQPHIIKNPTFRNPNGMRLPVVETASFCRRHDEENVVIPEGKEKGWPTEIDWAGLERRIDKEFYEPLNAIVNRKASCEFFEKAKAEWEAKGARKMANVMSEWGSFDIEQPGYYGPRGLENMIATLNKLFVTDTEVLTARLASPLPVQAYLRRVLVPELTVGLIMTDQKVSRTDASRIAAESRAYGKAMFTSSEEEEAWKKEEEKREEREERRREKQKERDEERGRGREKVRKRERREEERRAEEEALEKAKAYRRKQAKAETEVVPMDVDEEEEERAPAKVKTGRLPKRLIAAKVAAEKEKDKDKGKGRSEGTSTSGPFDLTTQLDWGPRDRAPSSSSAPEEIDSDDSDDEAVVGVLRGNGKARVVVGTSKGKEREITSSPPKKKAVIQLETDSDDD